MDHRRTINPSSPPSMSITTPLHSTPIEIGCSSNSSLDATEHPTPSWGKSHNVVSSIFKPRRGRDANSHPSHLNVPMLAPSATSSWGFDGYGHQQQHAPPPYSPSTTRSPKTIRFRDDLDSAPFQDDVVEVTPQINERKHSSSSSGANHRGGFVSRRGRRPGLISRHATH